MVIYQCIPEIFAGGQSIEGSIEKEGQIIADFKRRASRTYTSRAQTKDGVETQERGKRINIGVL
jgi:hypothetical protein